MNQSESPDDVSQTNFNQTIDEFASLEKEIAQELDGGSYDQLMEELSRDVAQEGASSGDAGGGSAPQVEHRMARGRIVEVRGEDVFVTLTGYAGKDQGLVPASQFDREPKIGSIMDFVVERHDESQGLVHLSREGAVSRATWDSLQRGSVVEARVTGSNKGGLELEMIGGIRAFMPASQVESHFVEDLEVYVGQKVTAIAREVDQRAKKVVLSRRAHLEAQRRAQQEKLWAELEEGQVCQGTVTRVMDYGVFVDLGGLDGLVHVSDMSYQRVHKPKDHVEVGQTVQVKVLKVDRENERVGLGMKQVTPDPWDDAHMRYTAGEQVTGKVVRTTDFGAFVELEPGIEGLLPIGEMSWKRIRYATDVVREGQMIRLMILDVDPNKQRLSLSLKQAHGDPWIGIEGKYPNGELVEGTALSTTPYGAFIELEEGVEGLVHISELSDRRVGQVEDVLKTGERHKFRVLSVDEGERRIRLSLKAVNDTGPAAGEAQLMTNDRTHQSSRFPQAGKKKPFKPLKGGIE